MMMLMMMVVVAVVVVVICWWYVDDIWWYLMIFDYIWCCLFLRNMRCVSVHQGHVFLFLSLSIIEIYMSYISIYVVLHKWSQMYIVCFKTRQYLMMVSLHFGDCQKSNSHVAVELPPSPQEIKRVQSVPLVIGQRDWIGFRGAGNWCNKTTKLSQTWLGSNPIRFQYENGASVIPFENHGLSRNKYRRDDWISRENKSGIPTTN